MNVVDSSAWIEFFVDGPNAASFEAPIRDTEALLVPAISLLEVYRYVLGQRGREAALDAAAAMRQGQIVEIDTGLAMEAAELGASLGLPSVDSLIYASALHHGAMLWTQDPDFAGLQSVEYRSPQSSSPD